MRWKREIGRTLVAGLAVGVACTVGNRERGDGSSRLHNGPVGPIAEAQAQSGTRLKARWMVGSDGARQFVNWHDSQLNADCSFSAASDGSMRCIPSGLSAGGFSDAACTQRLFATTLGSDCDGPAPRFGLVHTYDICGSDFSSSVFSLGEPVTPTVMYTDVAGGCQEQPFGVDADHVYLPATAQLGPSDFVGAEYATDP